jgi:hypothetical protein
MPKHAIVLMCLPHAMYYRCIVRFKLQTIPLERLMTLLETQIALHMVTL